MSGLRTLLVPVTTPEASAAMISNAVEVVASVPTATVACKPAARGEELRWRLADPTGQEEPSANLSATHHGEH